MSRVLPQYAFLYTGSGPLKDLGTLGGPNSDASGINDLGQIVGVTDTSVKDIVGNYISHPFLYTSGTMLDLCNRMTPNSGWTSISPQVVNDSGEIAGYGWNAKGQKHAFILTPASPGDANLDGRVDINDLTIVLTNYGQTGMVWSQGDFDNDGTVDINDLTIVLTNYGMTSSAGIKAMPEPAERGLARHRCHRAVGRCLANAVSDSWRIKWSIVCGTVTTTSSRGRFRRNGPISTKNAVKSR